MADWSSFFAAPWFGVGQAMPEAYGADAPIMDPLAKALISTATLPRRAVDAAKEDSAYYQQNGMDRNYEPKSIGPALEAAMLPMGTGAIAGLPLSAGEMALGSGLVRSIPKENYLGPISRYTDTLYREMSPSEALVDLPTSVAHGGYGIGGSRRFYADTPDLALGQGYNKGVRVEYNSEPFEGTVNRDKPAWDIAFQNGNAEYLAAPRVGENIRDSVRRFEIDPSSLSRVETAQYNRLLKNLSEIGWSVEKTPQKITVTKPK